MFDQHKHLMTVVGDWACWDEVYRRIQDMEDQNGTRGMVGGRGERYAVN